MGQEQAKRLSSLHYCSSAATTHPPLPPQGMRQDDKKLL